MNDALHLFAPILKAEEQPDGSVLAHVRITSEAIDGDGEVLDYEASKAAVGDWMTWANVREMHQPSAVGTALAAVPNDDERAIDGTVRVVDPTAAMKVIAGVYKGVSVGGRRLAVATEKVADRDVRRVTKWSMAELSLVDRPSNPDARLVLAKRDPDEEAGMADDGTETATAGTTVSVSLNLDGKALAKVVTEALTPDTTAPEAGVDVYLDEDGKPLAKAEDPNVGGGTDREKLPESDFAGKDRSFPIVTPGDVSDAAASIGRAGPDNYSTDQLKSRIIAIARRKGAAFVAKLPAAWREDEEKAEAAGDIAKSAAADVAHATMVLNCIHELIESEAAEGEADDVAYLTGARDAMLAFIAAESKEVGTPDDASTTDEAQEAEPMAMALTADDIRKIADAVDEELAKRSRVADPLTPDPDPTPEEDAPVADLLAKTMTYLDERFAQTVSRPELAAMQAAILGALEPLKEDLAKVAKFPAPGGPLRYAVDGARFGPETDAPTTEAEVLAKAARSATDPHLREELGRMAAAAEIAAGRRT